MRFVDTNIFLRLMINDDPQKADACAAIFRNAIAGRENLFTTDMVIAEIVWVLESFYGLDRKDICEKVEKILNTRNLNISNRETILNALIAYKEKNIDYIDAYNACALRDQGINEVYSFDRHYDRLPWLKRISPV